MNGKRQEDVVLGFASFVLFLSQIKHSIPLKLPPSRRSTTCFVLLEPYSIIARGKWCNTGHIMKA